MIIKQIVIKNTLSFQDETTIDFDEKLNILIGPNGGGKSNLLDIILIAVRKYLMKPISVRSVSNGIETVQRENIESDVSLRFSKFYNDFSFSKLKIVFLIKDTDIELLRTIHLNSDKILSTLRKHDIYNSFDLSNIKHMDIGAFKPDDQFELVIDIDNNKVTSSNDNLKLVMSNMELLNYILQKDSLNIVLPQFFINFTPYRGGSQPSSSISLSEHNLYNLYFEKSKKTSRVSSDSLAFSTLYFAQKHRKYESLAVNSGFSDFWSTDPEVLFVEKYLNEIGYSWSMNLVNADKNTYEVVLLKNNSIYKIENISSGEREFVNFLFGIFSSNVKSGCILIDEPELHLHPKWQKILLSMLIDLTTQLGCQLIMTTHSSIFVNLTTINNIIRINKDLVTSKSVLKKISYNVGDNIRKPMHIINSHNNERVFFADVVLLVEGLHDRIFLSELINRVNIRQKIQYNYEIVEVNGKSFLSEYSHFLDLFGITHYIIADLDYALNLDYNKVISLFKQNVNKSNYQLVRPKSLDGKCLLTKIEQSISTLNMNELSEIVEHLKRKNLILRNDLNESEMTFLYDFINEQKQKNIYLLSKGTIEEYLTIKSNTIEKLIHSIMEENISTWLQELSQNKNIEELLEILASILKMDPKDIYNYIFVS